MLGVLRRLPHAVSAFLILTVILFTVGLARSPKLWHHPAKAVLIVALVVLWTAAVVVWRQRWAWALMLLATLIALLSPAWGEWNGALFYVANVVTLALLLSPGMLRWVGVRAGRRRVAAA